MHTKVTGPDNKVIYSGERESSGKYAFAAHMHGVYKYCFGNQMSSMTPKTVMFGFDLSETAQDGDGVCVCVLYSIYSMQPYWRVACVDVYVSACSSS